MRRRRWFRAKSTLNPSGDSPKRKSRIRAKGKGWFRKRRDPAHRKWIRQFPCVVCGRDGESECCHVKTRGAGGDDIGNTVPMDRRCHDEQHRVGLLTFERRHGIDLALAAAGFGEAWDQRQLKGGVQDEAQEAL